MQVRTSALTPFLCLHPRPLPEPPPAARSTYLPTSPSTYIPVTTQGYWEIPSDGIAIDGTLVSGTSFKAAIDTGTTLIYIPRAAAKALYGKLGGTEKGSTGEWTVPCASTFSSIALSFGGRQFQMPLRDVFLGCRLLLWSSRSWREVRTAWPKLTPRTHRRFILIYRQMYPRHLWYRPIRCRG